MLALTPPLRRAGESITPRPAGSESMGGMDPAQSEKGERFRALHEAARFISPSRWDGGAARVLEALGFAALGTTSSGFASTLGRRDGGATLDEVEAHVRALSEASSLPVSVDLENGYGPEPADAANAIARVARAG